MSSYVRRKLSPGPHDRFFIQPSQTTESLELAYALVLRETRALGDVWAAWKLGGTTAATRAAFGVTSLYFGPIHAFEVHVRPTSVSTGHLAETKGEMEVALRLAPSIASIDIDGLRQPPGSKMPSIFDAWCFALEMPSSPIINLPAAGVNALVADRCAAGVLILGAPHAIDEEGWHQPLSLAQGSEIVSTGAIGALLDPLRDVGTRFCLEALEQGFSLRGGQWVSTGGLSACVPLATGMRTVLRAGDDTVLDFRLVGTA